MSQRFRVVVTGPAARDLNRVPQRVLPAILDFLYGPLAENPRRVGAELAAPLAGHHGARRGSYRIIYRIDEADLLVYVVRIAARADVYGSR